MKLIETICIVDGEASHVEYHNRRAGFALPEPILPSGLGLESGRVKWRFVYGEGAEEQDFTPYVLPSIRSLQCVDGGDIDYARKYEDRAALNALFARRGSCDDVLIIRDGWVTDTSFCNVVFENEEGLFTPSHPLLEGTKRRFLLDRGIIAERDIAVNDIASYDRVRLVNAMLDLADEIVVPIESIRTFCG